MKKTLALVLALVMVIGMMAVPASAAYTDAADIQYKEAVDVMSAIGVIEGYNNEFNPKGELTRAAGAKLVAYLELGAKQAEALTAEKAPFADVPADHWAAGYIGWAASKGYINGVGDNNFAPDAPLTALAYAKLMLCALGYDAAIEGFTGNGWEYNVMALALDADIFNGNDDADFAAVATREEAALYSFNALKAPMVQYKSKGTTVEINGAVISTGATEAEYVVATDSDKIDKATHTVSGKDLVELAEKRYTDLEKLQAEGDDVDVFGRPSVTWEYDGEEVGTYSETPIATYTKQIKEKDLYTDLGVTGFQGKAAKYVVMDKIIVDGEVVATATEKTASDGHKYWDASAAGDYAEAVVIAKGASTVVRGSGNGNLVEIYETDNDDRYIMVCVNTYVGKITDWSKADADKGIKEKITVTAEGAGTVGTMTFETTAYTEDDAKSGEETVVVFTKAADEIQSVATAGVVEATPTAYESAKFTAGGEAYTYGQYFEGTKVNKAAVDAEEDIVIYTDTYGYVVMLGAVDEDDAKIAYVVAVDTQDVAFGEAKKIAKLVLEDGSVVTPEYKAAANYTGYFVEYTVDKDDVYTLVKPTHSYNGDVTVDVDAGKAATVIGSDTKYANSKTVYFVMDKDDNDKTVYETYTGIANVPSLNDTNGVAVLYNDAGTTIKALYVSEATIDNSSDADGVVYVIGKSSAEEKYDAVLGAYYEHVVIADGEATTMKFASKQSSTVLVKSLTLDENGVVKSLGAAVSYQNTATGTNKLSDGNITFDSVGTGSVTTFAVASDVEIVVIDGSDYTFDVSASAVADDSNDTVIFVTDKNAVAIEAMYIVKVAA